MEKAKNYDLFGNAVIEKTNLKDDFLDQQLAEKNSKKIYAFFQDKIDQLRIEYSSEISNDKLKFITV